MSTTDNDVTFDPDLTRAATPEPGRTTSFAPGSIIAGRYRLVALLGRGGMGEVYRADDLTLDQPVALKFLPGDVAAGDTRLGQFHNELRVARQVSHKNVCRLYDLGEAGGRRFLTMEYVDGEDLGSLLRRIGRIPHDKAVQIARQLCAGVAAAHDRGVLHRDLKPANVMIDGDGNVRITDFGIATAAGAGTNELAGTPQYMAPEQFEGKGASIKSDVYALGLTLFEVFTGRRAQESKTLDELKKFHSTGTHTTPSSIVRDLDPAVERVIMRCLERDPDRRPASALVVAAALPGADPLAAALAAGETPSPEILAAAGESAALHVWHGVALAAVIIIGLLAYASVQPRASIAGRVPFDKPPAVLVDRAMQIITGLGYEPGAGDEGYSFMLSTDYLDWLRQTVQTPQRWDTLKVGRPSAVLFWYRTSPRSMRPLIGSLAPEDPVITDSNQRMVVLDPQGRLLDFRSVPPQFEKEEGAASTATPSWNALFDAAGLSMSTFRSVPSIWTPRDFADTRAAWDGPLPEQPDITLHVEAAAYRGKVVSFQVAGPWTQATRMNPRQVSGIDRVAIGVLVTVLLALIVAAALLARGNLRTNRADRRGAARLVFFVVLAGALDWLVSAHHASQLDTEVNAFGREAGNIALGAALVWMIYVALEPYVRRFWPDSLLGWSRLLAGHIKDPRVGHDVLIGAVFGVALGLVDLGKVTIIPWLGYVAPRAAFATRLDVLGGAAPLASAWIGWTLNAVLGALLTILIVVVLRLVLKRNWLVVPLAVLMLSATSLNYIGGTSYWILIFPLLAGALHTLVAFRFGFLAIVATSFVWNVLSGIPMMPVMSHWSATAGNWTLAGLVALTLFAFYASRAGQPLFGRVAE